MGEWVRENAQYSWLQKLCMRWIKFGPVPNHVAIIMDGNRRFARMQNIHRVQGHTRGFEKLAEVISKFFLVSMCCILFS